jgi:simple sugar transport system substrate-binding protein
MSSRRGRPTFLLALVAALALLAAACSSNKGGGGTPTPTVAKQFVFGMILVGPQNDHGWSQANYEGGKYIQDQLGAKMIVIDKVNPADRPNTTVPQVVSDMIDQGAQLIFATSDDFKFGIIQAAQEHPDVPMIFTSGDTAWPEAQGNDYKPKLTNLGNVMGKMEYGKMIAGCAAALTTQTGKLGYLGPLTNAETLRLANSVYLGARYCWQNYRHQDPSKLQFTVKWIGYWFNIPGQTQDPTQVANDFFDSGVDVVVSGIDTTEALVRAGQRAASGEKVWAIPYDFKGACAGYESVCLGVPYFNWGPAYLNVAKSVIDGTFKTQFQWLGPDWSNINDPNTSMVGFEKGQALSSANSATLDQFIAGLGDGSIDLYTGPLNWQDGSVFLKPGEKATDVQVWYAKQLLQGMKGASKA